MGESTNPRAKLRFDRRVRLEFHGATITSDAGLLACRELDDALGLTETTNECLQESRGGRNVQHRLVGLLRQSVYSLANLLSLVSRTEAHAHADRRGSRTNQGPLSGGKRKQSNPQNAVTDFVENCLLQGLRYYEISRAVIIRSVGRPKIVCVRTEPA